MSTPTNEENLQAIYGPIPGANDVPSPVSSPSPSSYDSPRALSATPPPIRAAQRSSPQMTLSSFIVPVYPKANFSPTRSASPTKASRSSSPSNKHNMLDSRSSPDNSDSEHRGRHQRNGHPEIHQPLPRRPRPSVLPRSEESSLIPQPIPLQVKQDISTIVRGVLRPHWKSKQLTQSQYEDINRDVSHKIYAEVKNPSAISDDAKQNWEDIARREVARAVAELVKA